MKKFGIFLLPIMLLICSCSPPANHEGLRHLVLFKAKSEDDAQKLVSELSALGKIDEVKSIEVGRFLDLEDARALSDYQVILNVTFENKAEYATYQSHDIHLAVKENVKKHLSGPPVSYDYTVPD